MIENSSMIHEYQVASAAALDATVLDEWPEAVTYLAYPESIALWEAVKKARAIALKSPGKMTDDPLLLASLMVKNGYPEATPEFVAAKMLMVGKTWPTENMASTVGYLKEMYERREGDKYLTTLQQQIKIGRIDFAEAEQLFSKRRTEIAGVRQDYILNAQDAGAYGEMNAAYRRQMVLDDKVPKLPHQLDRLQKEVALELDTLVLITGPTGGGKSVLAEMLAENLMEKGESVLYVLTELTKAQAIWRRIARKYGVSYERLRLGYWEKRFNEELDPRPNSGRIDYFEGNGVPLDQILNEARRRKAHLILDYWDMITLGMLKAFGAMKGISLNKGDLIGAGLADAKGYAQHQKRLVVVVQQYGKDAEAGPIDSARFVHRSNLYLKICMDVCKDGKYMFHPYVDDLTRQPVQLWIKPGKIDPVGSIVTAKDTFGGSAGNKYPVFLDGPRFRFIPTDVVSPHNPVVQSVDQNL